MGTLSPLEQFEKMGQANMKLFQSAMEMFTPFADAGDASDDKNEASPSSEPTEDIADLKQKLDAIQSQLDSLAKKDGD